MLTQEGGFKQTAVWKPFISNKKTKAQNRYNNLSVVHIHHGLQTNFQVYFWAVCSTIVVGLRFSGAVRGFTVVFQLLRFPSSDVLENMYGTFAWLCLFWFVSWRCSILCNQSLNKLELSPPREKTSHSLPGPGRRSELRGIEISYKLVEEKWAPSLTEN